MKLVDLDAAGTRQRYDNYLSVGFSDDVFEQLKPYRENREAAGFVRLAVGVLLALTYNTNDMTHTADELTCACGDMVDLWVLATGCQMLGRELESRATAIEQQGE